MKDVIPAEGAKVPRFVDGKSRWPFLAGAAIALAVGVWRAVSLRWICDDAFITLRYVQNWFDGFGLVFNQGEYVEGYTHPLWLLLLAAARGVRFDPVAASMWLGIAAYAGTLIVFVAIAARMRGGTRNSLPYAALALAMNYDVGVWATGGLETSFATFLLSIAFYTQFYSRRGQATRLTLTGLLLTLATLARPDAALFLAGGAALLFIPAVSNADSWSACAMRTGRFIAPAIVILLPYALWKLSYYGDLLPMTFYAKSGGSSFFEQGVFYIWLYFKAYVTSWLFLAAIPLIVATWFQRRAAASETANDAVALATAVGGVLLYLMGFVARVGGDFMYARFLIPVVPFIYFAIEDVIRRVGGERRLIWLVLALAPLFYENRARDGVLFDTVDGVRVSKCNGADALGETRGIVDERWFYTRPCYERNDGVPLNLIDAYRTIGESYRTMFAGLNIGVCIGGGQNVIAYYAQFPVCIITFGLTDKTIASLPLASRGRIGHERTAPNWYLARRHVAFVLTAIAERPNYSGAFYQAWFHFPELGVWQSADITYYDPETMEKLRARLNEMHDPCVLADYNEVVDHFISYILRPDVSKDTAIFSYERLATSYFPSHPDSARQKAILDSLRECYGYEAVAEH